MAKSARPLWIVLATTLVGCGGVSIDEFPGAYEDAICEYQVRCLRAESLESCKEALVFTGVEFQTTLDDVDSGLVTYDEDKAGECLDELEGQNCAFEGVHGDSPCNHVFTGTVLPGGACMIDQECKDGGDCTPTDTNCDPDVACCPGTCGPAEPAGIASGGACEDTSECASGLYCKPSPMTTGGTCSALISTEGSPCDDLFACANPMICDLFAEVSACVTPPGSGEACDPMALVECADFRDYCDGTSLTCVRAPGAGAACPQDECVSYASCENGTCVASPGLGDPCSATTPDCAGSLECVAGTCQAPPPGMSCQ